MIGKIFKWFFIVLGTIILVGALTCAIGACYAANYVKDVIIPQVESSSVDLMVIDTTLSSSIYYYDTDTESYQTLQTLYAGENREWVTFDEIPENLVNATVAIEDKRFWEHQGVDWKRTAAAVVYMFSGQSVQGGSTITQQLIKNITQENDVTVKRKVLEIFEALEFTKTHSKEQTLEWYLNYIYLGRKCYGVVTAAQTYFGKDLDELSLAECASLISITNNPSLYDPYTKPENNHTRAKTVILEMYKQGYISEQERDEALDELGMVAGDPVEETDTEGFSLVTWLKDLVNGDDEESDEPTLTYTYDPEKDKIDIVLNHQEENKATSIYSWYTDAVIDQVVDDLVDKYGYDRQMASDMLYGGGLQIYCSLDPKVQSIVDEVYENTENFASYTSSKGQDLMSGITIVDNSTGAVVALSGGVGEKTTSRGWSCATDTKRPSGSSIKPLAVYAPAIEEGLITPYSTVDDSPFMLDKNDNLWPVNSEGYYRGLTTVRTGVVESLNTLAVKVLDMEGTLLSYDYLTNRFGITSLVGDDINYAPLALGGQTYGVSTFEMAAAFSTFPRGGSYTKPYLYTVVLDSDGNEVLTTDGYTSSVDKNGNVTISGTASSTAILSESTCFYITDMLRGVINASGGTGHAAQISGVDVAGKTGTTTNDYDRWFCGYSSDYTASVWVGYDSQERIRSSTNPATVLWQKVMSRISEMKTPADMEFDVETVKVKYCTISGDLPTEVCQAAGCVATGTYVKGDEPTSSCQMHQYIELCKTSGKVASSECRETEQSIAIDYVRTEVGAMADIAEAYKPLSTYHAAGICEGEKAVFGEPVFVWAEDGSSCKATFTSTDELDVVELDCTVTSEVKEPAVGREGQTIFTATVEFEENTYTNQKIVVIPALAEPQAPTQEPQTPTQEPEDPDDPVQDPDPTEGNAE